MKKFYFVLMLCISFCLIWGCGTSSLDSSPSAGSSSFTTKSGKSSLETKNNSSKNSSQNATSTKGSRDNTAHALVPEASGIQEKKNDSATIDTSHADEGYIMANYYGTNPKVKIRITKTGGTTYTYDMVGGWETFPLSAGNGEYLIKIFENISGTDYSTCISETINVTMTNEFGAFLYPNKYVWFTPQTKAVAKGSELVASANSDLDAVALIYDYVINNIAYDHDLASNLPNGYIPDPEDTYETKIGICLDYASLMACMLRTQNIPCHLEVGYAGTAYHAWISVYITDIGWINGIIEFDGKNWKIMDPTYAANSSQAALKEFIGDNKNYQVKYVY